MSSFSSILSLDFFATELLKWISVTEISRLKCTCKVLNCKFSLDFCIESYSNPIIFRIAVAFGKLEVVEKLIIFYFQQQTKQTNTVHAFFPNFIVKQINSKACELGNLKLIKLLFSNLQQSKKLFPSFFELNIWDQISQGQLLTEASKHNNLEILEFYFDLFSKLSNNNHPSRLHSIQQCFEASYTNQIQFQEKIELNLYLLKFYSTHIDQNFQLLLNEINRVKNSNQNNNLDNYLEFLFVLNCPSFRGISSIKIIFSFDTRKLAETFEHFLAPISFIRYIEIFPTLIPDFFIDKFAQLAFHNVETTHLHNQQILRFRQKWHAFACEIDSFRTRVKTVQDVLGRWSLQANHPMNQCLLSFVLHRCVYRANKEIDEAFRHCMHILRENVSDFQTHFDNFVISFSIPFLEHERLDLISEMLEFIRITVFSHTFVYAIQTRYVSTPKTFKFWNLVLETTGRKNGDASFDFQFHPASFENIDLFSDLKFIRSRLDLQETRQKFINYEFPILLTEMLTMGDFEAFKYLISLLVYVPSNIPNQICRDELLRTKNKSMNEQRKLMFKYLKDYVNRQ